MLVCTVLSAVKAPLRIPSSQEKVLPLPVKVPVPLRLPREAAEPSWKVAPLPRLTVPFSWILAKLSTSNVPAPLILTPALQMEGAICKSSILPLARLTVPLLLKATPLMMAVPDEGSTTLPLLLNWAGLTQQEMVLIVEPACGENVPVLLRIAPLPLKNRPVPESVVVPAN